MHPASNRLPPPQWLFYGRIMADILGRLLPRRRSLMVTAPGVLLAGAVGLLTVGAAFFVYLQVGGVWGRVGGCNQPCRWAGFCVPAGGSAPPAVCTMAPRTPPPPPPPPPPHPPTPAGAVAAALRPLGHTAGSAAVERRRLHQVRTLPTHPSTTQKGA